MIFGYSKYKIIFVTGKGGVGKSVISAAIAMAEARKGKKVLLAELGSRSFFEKFLGFEYKADSATLKRGLDVARWESDVCMREYLVHYLRLDKAVDLFLDNKIMKALIGAAPGVNEVVLLGKITSGHRHRWHSLRYDVIVVDAFATGHFMSLMQAPRGLYEMVTVGPMASQCKGMLDIIQNPDYCRYVIVTLPEELPVSETLELHRQLDAEVGIAAEVVCNKTLPPEYREEVEALVGTGRTDMESYLHYLNAYYQRQGAALESLAAVTESVRTVPYYFQTEPEGLVQAIAAQM